MITSRKIDRGIRVIRRFEGHVLKTMIFEMGRHLEAVRRAAERAGKLRPRRGSMIAARVRPMVTDRKIKDIRTMK